MDIYWTVISGVVGGVASACWIVGSAGETKRSNFKEWLLWLLSALAPGVRWVMIRSLFLGLTLLCAAVLVGVWIWVSGFLASDQPLQRKEVFLLCVQLFNGLTYGSAFFAFLLLTIRGLKARDKHQEDLILLRQGERLVLSFADEEDLDAAARQIFECGVIVTLRKLDRDKATLVIEMPSLMTKRVEQTKVRQVVDN